MNLSGNIILITGGGSGIGLELAIQLDALGNTVIICGRRLATLELAEKKAPNLIVFPCDIGDANERRVLANYCIEKHPNINILINNAGIQRVIDFTKGDADFSSGDCETSINLEASMHLAALFTPHFLMKKEAAIVNIGSGLGLVPLQIAPAYSASKAGLHSFSISLRRQLKNTSIKVFEILPPIVDTNLDKGARDKRGQHDKGIPAEDAAKQSIAGLAKDQYEMAIGKIKFLRVGNRIAPAFFLNLLNRAAKPNNR